MAEEAPKADAPKEADRVHEQTREKGEKAREEREKIEQQEEERSREQRKDDRLEAPPGD